MTTLLRQQPVKIELGNGKYRNITRSVHGVRTTGHIAKAWSGNEYVQWRGFVHYEKQIWDVWGYSVESGVFPTEWANDTY